MAEHEAARTLVKSPPELWEACSDAESLGRHLRPFGEIRITRLEPETTVAWEGERASGTVTIEPSGWGTKVTLTALADGGPQPEPVAAPAPGKPPRLTLAEPAPRPRSGGLLGRLLGMFRSAPVPEPAPEATSEPAFEPAPEATSEPAPAPETAVAERVVAEPASGGSIDAPAALDAALESLGQAHHRPYSRG
jgi:hypothetical protein